MLEPIEGNDVIFPSSNNYGIPDLLLSHQAKSVDLPWISFRSCSISAIKGTLHFYVDDYRFENALWNDPNKFNGIRGNLTTIVEPNYSNSPDTPKAVRIYQAFRKRWLARYWQSKGFKTVVDLCVFPEYLDDYTLGVPKGWSAFSTRIYDKRLSWVDVQFEKACEISGNKQPLFILYGGGKKAREYAINKGFCWIPEHIDRVKGVYKE